MMKHSAKILLISSSVFILSGCTSSKMLAREATSYNTAVESAQNKVLLLNIIRAAKDRPRYFTGIREVTGSFTYSSNSGGLQIPFGPKAVESYAISPSIGYSNSPTFSVSVLDTKEFTSGILSPVNMQTVKYFWDTGLPHSLLMHLFVRKMEIADSPTSKEVLENAPDNPKKSKAFSKEVDELLMTGLSITSVDLNNLVGPKLALKDVQNIDHVLKAKAKGYSIVELKSTPGFYKLQSNKSELIFKVRDGKEFTTEGVGESIHGANFTLRSPEAILDYLGKIARVSLKKNDCDLTINTEQGKEILFCVEEVKQSVNKYIVTVDYDGKRYGIPLREEGRDKSMAVLTLVSQLFGLHKFANELPSSSAVRLIPK